MSLHGPGRGRCCPGSPQGSSSASQISSPSSFPLTLPSSFSLFSSLPTCFFSPLPFLSPPNFLLLSLFPSPSHPHFSCHPFFSLCSPHTCTQFLLLPLPPHLKNSPFLVPSLFLFSFSPAFPPFLPPLPLSTNSDEHQLNPAPKHPRHPQTPPQTTLRQQGQVR